jgi:hypothetical protein
LSRADEFEILIEDYLLVPAVAENELPVATLLADRDDLFPLELANRIVRRTAKVACDCFRKIEGSEALEGDPGEPVGFR